MQDQSTGRIIHAGPPFGYTLCSRKIRGHMEVRPGSSQEITCKDCQRILRDYHAASTMTRRGSKP